MQHKRLVIDANILIRAVLGSRVRGLIEHYCNSVAFYIAEANVDEAEFYLSTELAAKRGLSEEVWRQVFEGMLNTVQIIADDVLIEVETEAKARTIDAAIREDRGIMGEIDRAQSGVLWHPHDAQNGSTGGPKIFVQFNCSSGTRSSKARCAISASRWMTPWKSQNRRGRLILCIHDNSGNCEHGARLHHLLASVG